MVEKGNDIVGKLLKLVCVQNNDIVKDINTNQNERAELATFSSYNTWLFFEGHDTTESEHDVQNS